MKHFPTISKYKKPHKKKTFKGQKALLLKNYTSAARLYKPQRITYEQLEAIRRAIVRLIKPREKKQRRGQALRTTSLIQKRRKKRVKKHHLLFKAPLTQSLTKKPLNVRMGKGSGAIDKWVHPATSSETILEMSRHSFNIKRTYKFFLKARKKFPNLFFTYDRKFRREQEFKKTKN